MASLAEIRAALETRLGGVTGLPPAAARARENEAFDRPAGKNWVGTALRPGSRELITAPAEGGYLAHAGLYLVDVFVPAAVTVASADTLAQAVVDRFPPGLSLPAGAQALRILRSVARGGFRDDGWYQVPVEIGWQVETINSVV